MVCSNPICIYIWEALSTLRKRLNNRMEKYISSDTLCNLAEVVLKNNIFKFGKKNINGPAIGSKFVSAYSTVFMTEMEEEILRKAEFKAYLWWRYIDDIFFLCGHRKEKLKYFTDNNTNKMHPPLKFTADLSKTSINFLDITAYMAEGSVCYERLVYILNLLTVTNLFCLLPVILFTAKRVYHTDKH